MQIASSAVPSTSSRQSTGDELKKEVSPTSAPSAQRKERSAGVNKKKAPKTKLEAPTKNVQPNDTTKSHGLPVNGNFNLNQLVPESVCDQCGKVFLMGIGVKKKDYVYKMQVGSKLEYYCSYHCLCEARKKRKKK